MALVYIAAGFMMASCTSIDNLEPNQTNTFLKFYSETNTMKSKDLLVLEDGFLILSTYTDTTTLLLKTDFLGNKIWAKSLPYFQGSSVTQTSEGYIVIGDSINTQNGTSFMQLIKTTKENGTIIKKAFIGTGTQHGAAVTFTENNEIIALGYTAAFFSKFIILMGYNTDLEEIWSTPKEYLSEFPAHTVYDKNELITWLSYNTTNNSRASLTSVLHDNEGVESNPTLLNDQKLANTTGNLTNTPGGYAVTQSVLINGESKIGYSSLINGIIDAENVINEGEFETGNYTAYSLTSTLNGLLVAATTDAHSGETARTDKDVLLLEIDINGNLVSNGINQSYGGIGEEIPIRIRKTSDGGYIILGNSINSKGAQQSFLLKINSKGLLN